MALLKNVKVKFHLVMRLAMKIGSVVVEYEGNKRIEFKVLDSDYETYMIKVTEEGTYLCMNEPEPDEEKVKKFKVVGARVC